MNKKIIYGILILIILAGTIIISTIGLNVGVNYSKNAKIYIYLGKSFESKDIKQISKEVFETNNIMVQKVELYEDMVVITVKQNNVGNIDEKLEILNNKINEKYELKNKVEDIEVNYEPKTRLSSIVKPYVLPISISICIILIYALIRYKKIKIFEVLVSYIFAILVPEAVFLSTLAITRIPVNSFIPPIGVLIYIISLTIVTILKEKKLEKQKNEEK